MADFYINKRRDRVTIVPESDQGKKWIKQNMDRETIIASGIINIDVEHLEDFIKLFKEAELTYDENN